MSLGSFGVTLAKPESVFDFVQGIAALARGKTHQDTRLELVGRAKGLLERA